MQPAVQPEFSRLIRVDDLGPAGRDFAEVADARELAGLAARLGLMAVGRFEVRGKATVTRGGTLVLLSARLHAEVTQECVVTLASVMDSIEADFGRLYSADAPGAEVGEQDIIFDSDQDDIDPIIGGCIDVGEAAAEQLALVLDPYPRAPDASLERALAGTDRGEPQSPAPSTSPFAELDGFSARSDPTKRRK